MPSATTRPKVIDQLKWLFILPLYAASVAFAQFPDDPGGDPGGETFEITLEYNCCGTISGLYAASSDLENPDVFTELLISATSSGSTTFNSADFPIEISLSAAQGYVVQGLSVTQDENYPDDIELCFISSEDVSESAATYFVE